MPPSYRPFSRAWKPLTSIRCVVILSCVTYISSSLEEIRNDGLTCGRLHKGCPSSLPLQPVFSVCTGLSVIQPPPSGQVSARGGADLGLERKDRTELRAVILPFVRWNSSDGVDVEVV